MCKHGTEVVMEVTIPASDSHTGEAYRKSVGVDSCLATMVKALNDGGIATRACCCGHGHRVPSIALWDGRWIVVLTDAEYRALEAQNPVDIHGEVRPASPSQGPLQNSEWLREQVEALPEFVPVVECDGQLGVPMETTAGMETASDEGHTYLERSAVLALLDAARSAHGGNTT